MPWCGCAPAGGGRQYVLVERLMAEGALEQAEEAMLQAQALSLRYPLVVRTAASAAQLLLLPSDAH